MRHLLIFLSIVFVCNPCFSLSNEDTLDSKRRVFIEDFILTYEVAYERENLTYIEQIFSNDALILTETKELIKYGEQMIPISSKVRPFKTMVEDKQTYLERLRNIFKQHEKIRLAVANQRIMRHPKYGDIYGVSFFQQWMEVGDESEHLEGQMPGYVFLLVDFRTKGLNPIIHVRTWQPQSNITSKQDLYSIGDFKIYDTKK